MFREFRIAVIVQELDRDNLLPAIVFRTSRSQCDADVEQAGRNRRLHLSPVQQRDLRKRIGDIAERYEMEMELLTSHPHYNSLVLTGIGAHHAGQLLMWRLLLEELMAAGVLRVLVATGTVAAGVDFPARTVVITAHSKRGAEGFRKLTSAEFQQMSGRAGRRGKDTVGFCVAAPSAFCDAGTLLKISSRPAEPLVSAYFPGPSTVLNLLRYQNVDGLRFTVERSLASFIDRRDAEQILQSARELATELPREIRAELGDVVENLPEEGPVIPGASYSKEVKRQLKKIKRLRRQAKELPKRQLSLLESSLSGLRELGHLEGESLSKKGYWSANLCTSLVLEIAELIEEGLLENASKEDLAAIIASISGDPHRKYLTTKQLPLEKEQFAAIDETIKKVIAKGMPGVWEDRAVLPAAAHTVLTWMQAEDWQEFRGLLMLSGVAEGDAGRLITQTAEHLNQLMRLYESHPQLALRAEEAKHRVLRPPLTESINIETA